MRQRSRCRPGRPRAHLRALLPAGARLGPGSFHRAPDRAPPRRRCALRRQLLRRAPRSYIALHGGKKLLTRSGHTRGMTQDDGLLDGIYMDETPVMRVIRGFMAFEIVA